MVMGRVMVKVMVIGKGDGEGDGKGDGGGERISHQGTSNVDRGEGWMHGGVRVKNESCR